MAPPGSDAPGSPSWPGWGRPCSEHHTRKQRGSASRGAQHSPSVSPLLPLPATITASPTLTLLAETGCLDIADVDRCWGCNL